MTKHYEGPLREGDTISVVGGDLFSCTPSIESHAWALGEERHRLDGYVEAAIGKDKADAIRRKVAEHYEEQDDDTDDVIRAVDFGLTVSHGRSVFGDFASVWMTIGIKQAVPEVIALGEWEIVVKIPERGWNAKDLMDVVAKVYHVLEEDPKDHATASYDIYTIKSELVPLVEFDGDIESRWEQLMDHERRKLASMTFLDGDEADFGAWFTQHFDDNEGRILKNLIRDYVRRS